MGRGSLSCPCHRLAREATLGRLGHNPKPPKTGSYPLKLLIAALGSWCCGEGLFPAPFLANQARELALNRLDHYIVAVQDVRIPHGMQGVRSAHSDGLASGTAGAVKGLLGSEWRANMVEDSYQHSSCIAILERSMNLVTIQSALPRALACHSTVSMHAPPEPV